MSSDGLTVSFTTPLRYTHFAGDVSTTSHTGAPLRAAAAAGLLTRNIVIRGDQTDPADAGYGGHIAVVCITRAGQPTVWGRADFRFVEMRDMGKLAMEYPALGVQYGKFLDVGSPLPDPKPASVNVSLVGVTMSSLHNGGIYLTGAADALFIDRSIFDQPFPHGILADEESTGAVVTNSLVAGVSIDPTRNVAGQTPWVWPQAGLFFLGLPGWLDGNLVAGSYDSAYTFRPPDCGDIPKHFGSNEAASSRIGVFALPRVASSGTCVGIAGFNVTLASHVGILTVDQQSNFQARDVFVTDSHIAVSYSFVTSLSEIHGTLLRATIAATTALSTTVDSSTVPVCRQNAECMAMTKADVTGASCGSVFGPSVRRIGWLIPQVTNKGKTCDLSPLPVCNPPNQPERLCAMPWEKRFGLPEGQTKADWTLTSVTFVGFVGDTADCGGRSKAIAHNPTQVDYSPPGFLSDIKWVGSPSEGRFMFETNDQTDPVCQNG